MLIFKKQPASKTTLTMNKQELQIKKELPRPLIINGFLTIFFILLLLPFIAWLLEYKDMISAPLTITTKTPPIDVLAQTPGELKLLVKNNSQVCPNTNLALIKNTASLEAVRQLKALISLETNQLEIAKKICLLKNQKLGPIKPSFIELEKVMKDLEIFLETDQHATFMRTIEEQIELHKKRRSLLQQKGALLKQDEAFAQKFLEIDKSLLENKVIASRTYDQSYQEKLKKEIADLDNETLLNNLDIKIKALRREKIEIRSNFLAENFTRSNKVREALQLLKKKISDWEHKYLIKSKIEGICLFKDNLSDHIYVEAEEKLFSIGPLVEHSRFGLVKLPMNGAGKVKTGQEVFVKLSNFPYLEFGVIKGLISAISYLPFDKQYNVQVQFPNGFVSTYGDTIPGAPLMHGIAEIVVEKKSLYDRVNNQIKHVRYNR